MVKFSPLVLSAALLAGKSASAYEVGCLYPPTMPDPFVARYQMHEYSGAYMMANAIETPIVIHISSLSSLCQTNCLAYHDSKVLNALTKEEPLVRTPEEYHNAWSRMLCIAQCHDIMSQETGRAGFFDEFYKEWGLEGIQKRKDVVGLAVLTAQGGDTSALQVLLEEDDWHPFTMGQIVATEILLYQLEGDGWNALGNYTYDANTDEVVLCTANCERYKDTTGYYPKNQLIPGRQENDTEKYIVEGNDKHWAPLFDTDMNGFFSAQAHVVPHIGFKADTKLYPSVDDFPSAPDPEYDYYEESLQVIERLRETSSDPIKKQKIAFFDAKLLVINAIENEIKRRWADKYSFEEEILYINGMSDGEYEATLMAWRAKVIHDLVRPTTVIKRWGGDILNTFSGDKTVDGPKEIAARDFQAFQRVMPHAEYPSGSSCICTAYAEYTEAFVAEYLNETLTDIHIGGAGEGTGFGCDPDQVPKLPHMHGCEDDFVIADMADLLDTCSQSRLWAGFHYTAAVVEGEKMCKGVGKMAFDVEKKVRNGSTFGTMHKMGDPRPTCSDPSIWEAAEEPEMAEVMLQSESSAAASRFAFWSVVAAAGASMIALMSL